MKKIVCNIEIFDLYQHIFIVNTETGESREIKEVFDLNDLAQEIAKLSYVTAISNITLSGNKIFAIQLKQEILAYSKIKFGRNNLEIEVI